MVFLASVSRHISPGQRSQRGRAGLACRLLQCVPIKCSQHMRHLPEGYGKSVAEKGFEKCLCQFTNFFWQARVLYSATYKPGVSGNRELPVMGSVGDINHS